ncbi:MAG: hypothetical protein L6R38_008878 [Xanthoria sp. 2 TBL-2021]|nr:MAG: hypothetical protein L6R38_008878 [Xanthoria sp. 2 TBL-2021]
MVLINGKEVGHTGYGMMNLTWRTTQIPDPQAFSTLNAALATNTTFWNGGEFYGPPHSNSLHLLARYFTAHPSAASRVILSIKGAGVPNVPLTIEGSRANIHRSIDDCLSILSATSKKTIDIFEAGRVDPKVPLEETINAIAEYVKEGKVGGIGLSEVDAETIRKARAIHPIAAVEVELSLHTPDILTNGVAATCGELGIPIVAYSPLGRGLLTSQLNTVDDIDKDDIRHYLPRFAPGALEANASVSMKLKKIAERKGCTAAQVAIAWVRGWSGRDGMGEIVPIPGATTAERVNENAVEVALSKEEWEEVEELRKGVEVVGGRYPEGW